VWNFVLLKNKKCSAPQLCFGSIKITSFTGVFEKWRTTSRIALFLVFPRQMKHLQNLSSIALCWLPSLFARRATFSSHQKLKIPQQGKSKFYIVAFQRRRPSKVLTAFEISKFAFS